MTPLSALVITYNESKHVRKCIDSLKKVSDEIIVIDSYSTDNTVEICKKLGATVILNKYESQIKQKQFALQKANFDHVISLDGDERLDQELVNIINAEKINGFPSKGYAFNRKSFYCGKWIKYGDWYPDFKLRLWHKHSANWGGTEPHDKVRLHQGKVKKLKGNLLHYTFETKEEHQNQVKKYALIASCELRSKKFKRLRKWLSPAIFFLKSYIFKLGLLDGKLGWQITKLCMREKYQKYNLACSRQQRDK